MKKIFSKAKVFYQAGILAMIGMFMPVAAKAEPSLTLPSSVDLSALFPYASAIVAALVTLIVIRKAIKLSNRS